MNWKQRIRKLLGRFWSRLFSDRDIILWVENLFGLVAARQQGAHDKWVAGQALSLSGVYQERMPYVILLRKSTVRTSGTETSDVERPAWTFAEILSGKDPAAGPGDADSWPRGWLLHVKYKVPPPALITEHVINAEHTLFAGIDYEYVASGLLHLYVDPDTLKWPTEVLSDAEGNAVTYYRVFGWSPASAAVEDAVAAFESPELADCAVNAWDIHTHGTTVLSAKKLLADACSSVVCEEDGELTDVWQEQGMNCAVVGDCFYKSTQPLRQDLETGDMMKAGDTVFGSMYCYPDNAPDASLFSANVPGIHVMTDVGEMYAPNEELPAIVSETAGNVLPLEAAPATVAAYQARCEELIGLGVPAIEVPDPVNPCSFILDTLRSGSGLLVYAETKDARKASAALECIRRSTPADSMVQAYLRADAEPLSVSMSICDTGVFGAAVAVACSAKLAGSARAEVFL